MKIPKWQKTLTKKELAHLLAMGVTSKAAALRTFAHQKRQRGRAETFIEPCWECHFIAQKMGCEV